MKKNDFWYSCAATADCVIFSENFDSVVLIKRKSDPFKGQYALPGGFINEKECVESACIREVKEETNLDIKDLVFVGTYSDTERDPRGRVISFAFLSKADLSQLKSGDDASVVEIVRDWKNVEIGFDHKRIIEDSLIKIPILFNTAEEIEDYVYCEETHYNNKKFDFEKAGKVHKILKDNLYGDITCDNCGYFNNTRINPLRFDSGERCNSCIHRPADSFLNFLSNKIVDECL